jgi:hypothetical protein
MKAKMLLNLEVEGQLWKRIGVSTTRSAQDMTDEWIRVTHRNIIPYGH